jgi:hypothetical protein
MQSQAYTMKIRLGRRLQGVAARLVHPDPYKRILGPSFAGHPLPPYLRQFLGFGPGSVHLEWRFGALMRGSSISQGINPSSPLIKGGLPLLI